MPAKTKISVIIDTNLWISFLLMKDFRKLDHFLRNNRILLLFSQELLDEFIEVAQRPKFRKYFSLNELEDILIKVRIKAAFITVTSTVEICRDAKDNFLLSLAMDGHEHYLITGDKDLLAMEKQGRTQIVTMTDFLNKHGNIHLSAEN
jgi:putative PIN family toxin of toxin-antitoxin system